MSNLESTYYPPRARWYSPVFHLGDALRRLLHLEGLHAPREISWPKFLLSLLLPGFSFSASGSKLLGRCVMMVYALTVCSFLIWLGYPVSNLLFGLMISIHVSSLMFLLNPWLSEFKLVRRILFSLAILLIVSRLLYVPLLDLMEKQFAMPLRVRDQVVVANTMFWNKSIKRGGYVAYRFTGGVHHGVSIHDGYGLDSVLGIPGDQVRFSTDHYEINGKAFTRLTHMPTEGEWVVPEKQWFIWPSLNTVVHRNIAEENISKAVLKSALIPNDQIIGKPFRHWFWRRQIVP